MNRSIALSASLIIGFLAGSTGRASAVVSCQYVGILPVASYGPASQSRQPMMLGEPYHQSMLARVAL